jgi:hypothetical protein
MPVALAQSGRASGCQPEGRGSESHMPLDNTVRRSYIMKVAQVKMKVWTPDGEWTSETAYSSIEHAFKVIQGHLENPNWNNVRITMSRVNDD